MAFDAHSNFAYSTVLTAPSPATSGTTVVLQSGDGALFPAAPFNVAIWPAGAQPLASTAEIARCTAKSTDTLTITRAQEGTTARTVLVGDQIANVESVKVFTDIESATPAAILTTKGDQLGYTGSAVARHAIGSNGYVQRARSSQSDGWGWSPEYLGPIRPFAVNEWRLNYPQANSSTTVTSGALILAPTFIPFDFTLDGLGFLNAAGTAGTFRAVLFSDNGSGTPNVGIADSGALAVTTTGMKSATGLAVTGTRGLYWAGILAESITGSAGFENAGIVANPLTLWSAMPAGSTSTPSVTTGNDGLVAAATGISGSQIGQSFTGTLTTNHNSPNLIPCIWFRFSVVTL